MAFSDFDSSRPEDTLLVRQTYRQIIHFAGLAALLVSLSHATVLFLFGSSLWWLSLGFAGACALLLNFFTEKRRFIIFFVALLVFMVLFMTSVSVLALSLGREAGFEVLFLPMFPLVVVTGRIRLGAKVLIVILLGTLVLGVQEYSATHPPLTQLSSSTLTALRAINFASVILAISGIVSRYFHLVTQQQANLQAVATTDQLTGLYNRHSMTDIASWEATQAQRSQRPLSILVGDLDHFKTINDQHGHEAGDAALKHAARLLKASLRGSELVCRWGGEEFVVLLVNTDASGAKVVAERIRKRFENSPVPFNGGRLSLTLTLGGATLRPSESFNQLINRADQALYKGKLGGRNQVIAD